MYKNPRSDILPEYIQPEIPLSGAVSYVGRAVPVIADINIAVLYIPALYTKVFRLNSLPFFKYLYKKNNVTGKHIYFVSDTALFISAEIEKLETLQGAEINVAKKILAFEATKICRGETEAISSQKTATETFENKGIGSDLPTFELTENMNIMFGIDEQQKLRPLYPSGNSNSLALTGQSLKSFTCRLPTKGYFNMCSPDAYTDPYCSIGLYEEILIRYNCNEYNYIDRVISLMFQYRKLGY